MGNKSAAEQTRLDKNISQILELDHLDELRSSILDGPHDPDETINSFDQTLLMVSARSGSLECARFLVEVGADVECKDHTGRSALRYAARAGQPEVLDLLLEAGADPGVLDKNGETALMEAALTGSFGCVRKLAEAGADPQHRDDTGRNALDLILNKAEGLDHTGKCGRVAAWLLKQGVMPAAPADEDLKPLLSVARHHNLPDAICSKLAARVV